MATHATAIPTVGELRFIYRLNRASLDRGPTASDVRGCDTVVEGSDVFKCADGSIHTKFFSSTQFIDDQVHGVSGAGIGAWMILPGTAYERSSGGPFFRFVLHVAFSSYRTEAEMYRTTFAVTSTIKAQLSRRYTSINTRDICRQRVSALKFHA